MYGALDEVRQAVAEGCLKLRIYQNAVGKFASKGARPRCCGWCTGCAEGLCMHRSIQIEAYYNFGYREQGNTELESLCDLPLPLGGSCARGYLSWCIVRNFGLFWCRMRWSKSMPSNPYIAYKLHIGCLANS